MRKRNMTIAICCTEEESRRIHELAKRHGLKLNDFVMRCALGKKIVVANGINEIVRQQKAIGRKPQPDSYTCKHGQADRREFSASPR